MKSEYYSSYYVLEREHWFFLARNKIIMDYIRANVVSNQRSLRILNIGAGTGYTSELLAEFGDVRSLEYDANCVEFVTKKVGISIEQGDVTNLKIESNSYDLVCAFDVIEHVEDDRKAVSEMLRVCASNGHLIVTVPAFNALWGPHDEINMHKRRYTKGSLNELFDNEMLVYSSYFNFHLFVPIAIVKLWSRFLSSAFGYSGSDFKMAGDSGRRSLFYRIFVSESKRVSRRRVYPVGISILSHLRVG